MANLLNLMYIGNSWAISEWLGNGLWLVDRVNPYFHIAISHPNANGVQKESWKH